MKMVFNVIALVLVLAGSACSLQLRDVMFYLAPSLIVAFLMLGCVIVELGIIAENTKKS